ncbi:MAG: hypothetical protein ACK515_10585 [bacterium]|jgi:hypothetical protein|nr:hypothetical protein [Betaproteobacteria bacterium]
MKDVKAVFRNVETMLRQTTWFEHGWEIFNRGAYMQLYKSNWYNASQGGVHFETFIEDAQLRQKAFPIALHAEADCPSQQRFIEALVESERGRIQGWKGYRLVGRGYTVCERILPLNFKALEQRLLQEFNQLRELEAAVDQTLTRLEGKT